MKEAKKANQNAKAKAADDTKAVASTDPVVAWLHERGLEPSRWAKCFGEGPRADWMLTCVEKVSSTTFSDEILRFRSRLASDERQSILQAAGVLMGGVKQFDLRDNLISDDDCAKLAELLDYRDSLKITKLALAGNC